MACEHADMCVHLHSTGPRGVAETAAKAGARSARCCAGGPPQRDVSSRVVEAVEHEVGVDRRQVDGLNVVPDLKHATVHCLNAQRVDPRGYSHSRLLKIKHTRQAHVAKSSSVPAFHQRGPRM